MRLHLRSTTLVVLAVSAWTGLQAQDANTEWPSYGGYPGGMRHAASTQINIAAGGHGKLGSKLGDSVVAYALP